MRKLCVLFIFIIIMLPGCSKADDHTAVNGGLTKATNNNHQTQAGYSQNDEPQANQNIDEFLNDYINLIVTATP